jgi:glycerol kinase
VGSRHRAADSHAIVWQDRRTADACASLRQDGHEALISQRTGLLLDPYFSATKIGWLLDHVDGARTAAEQGRLAFGTIDSFLLWRLTGGRQHATDATNAARTLLLDIGSGGWDAELCKLFGVPASLLPQVFDCAADFGTTAAELFGGPIRILGMAGDQQAATVGQGCLRPGMMKATYGTGCFALLNTGDVPVASSNRLLTTIAYQLGGKRTYALEGAIFIAGAAVQWLRDALKMIATAPDVNALAAAADPAEQVFLVPAFVGLGAPWWDADARGAVYGLTRNAGVAELARAALEAVGYQTRDLLDAMRADWTGGGDTVSRRWRHGRERHHHAVSRRHHRRAGRSSRGDGDHGGGGRLSCRADCRALPGPCGIRDALDLRAPVPAADGRCDARAQMGRLARRGRADPERALSVVTQACDVDCPPAAARRRIDLPVVCR